MCNFHRITGEFLLIIYKYLGIYSKMSRFENILRFHNKNLCAILSCLSSDSHACDEEGTELLKFLR
ncbi:MAG: hypothetical protein AYK18_17930 [Theionarchaea archaeon DG-70]|nr:MAG: hypothetical protein AYK18_17930 [Theionarchaea archaeon DG-70]